MYNVFGQWRTVVHFMFTEPFSVNRVGDQCMMKVGGDPLHKIPAELDLSRISLAGVRLCANTNFGCGTIHVIHIVAEVNPTFHGTGTGSF